MAIDLKSIYSKILSGAQAVNSAVNSVNPYNKLIQSAGKAISQVPYAVQAFNPKNNVGGYLAQTLPYQSIQNTIKPLVPIQNKVVTPVANFISGKTNISNKLEDFALQNNKWNPNTLNRNLTNVALYPLRAAAGVVQGTRDVAAGSVEIGKDIGANTPNLLLGDIGKTVIGGLNAVGSEWSLTPGGVAINTTINAIAGITNKNDAYKGKTLLDKITRGLGMGYQPAEALNIDRNKYPIPALVVDLAAYILIQHGISSAQKANEFSKALGAASKGEYRLIDNLVTKYPKEFKDVRVEMEGLRNLKPNEYGLAEKGIGLPQVESQPPSVIPEVKPEPTAPTPSATPQEVMATIPDKIDNFIQHTLGYSTKEPVATGTKGASLYTKVLRAGQGKITTAVEKGLASQNPLVRNVASILQGFFRGLGMSPARAEASFSLRGEMSAANQHGYDVTDSIYKALGNNKATKGSLERINAILDPEISKIKVSFDELTPVEKEMYNQIRQGFDLINDISYATGNIPYEKYKINMGKYTPRAYEVYELPEEVSKFITQGKKMNLDMYKSREALDAWKIENSLNDPAYELGKRLTQVETNITIRKYTDFLASQSHLVSEVERPGFIKLSDSKAYGKLAGKYVLNSAAEDLKGYFFENEAMQNLFDVFKAYDRMGIRQLQKQFLTILNPVTNVGNITTDNVFGFLIGVDPLTLNANILKLKNNPSEFKQLSNYLMSKGITGTDITRTDFVNKLSSIDSLSKGLGESKNIFSKGTNAAQKFYGGTDDVYKVSGLKALLDQGKSLEEATTLVKDGFQNYATVGKFYDLYAKTPVIGKAFIKFQGDLIRIIKNATINRPLHLITFLASLYGIARLSSKLSGESDKDREFRENRFGAPKIPGLDIPLTWQTPMGELNIARYVSPLYSTNYDQGQEGMGLAKNMLPFVPDLVFNEDKSLDLPATIGRSTGDPLLGPAVQLIANRDFRGKPITDEKASPFFGSDLPVGQQRLNQATWLARNYTPPVPNTLIDIGAAALGQEDRFGKKRNVPQAVARAAGFKVEQFGPEEVKTAQSKNAYFTAKTPAWGALKADEKAAALAIPDQDPADLQGKIYKYTTLLQYPAVYNYKKSIAINQVNGDTSKVDPLYTASYNDAYDYMRYQTLVPGKTKSDFYKVTPSIGKIGEARSNFYKLNPIPGGTTSTAPQPTSYVQAQMDAKNWNDPQVKAYLALSTTYKNEQLASLGMPALTGGGSYQKRPYFKKFSAPKLKTLKLKKVKIKKLKFKKAKIYRLKKMASIKSIKLKKVKFA